MGWTGLHGHDLALAWLWSAFSLGTIFGALVIAMFRRVRTGSVDDDH